MGELARFKQGPLRYNSHHGTRLSWDAGLNSARWEREAPLYNSGFFVFGVSEGG